MSGYRPQCPVPGCHQSHPVDKMMCSNHWRKVPRDLQREVGRAYRRYQRDKTQNNLLELRSLQGLAIDAAAGL